MYCTDTSKEVQMAKRYMKKCLSFSHQGNANQSYIEIPSQSEKAIRMDIIKKIKSNKCWQGCGGKGTLRHY
jgi:hypothetical protein